MIACCFLNGDSVELPFSFLGLTSGGGSVDSVAFRALVLGTDRLSGLGCRRLTAQPSVNASSFGFVRLGVFSEVHTNVKRDKGTYIIGFVIDAAATSWTDACLTN